MAPWLSVLIILPEDPNVDPSTHSRHLITTCKLSSRGSDAFGLLVYQPSLAYTTTQTHMYN